MSLMDREYMRRDTNDSNKAEASKDGSSGRHGSRLVGISRSEKISLVIGAIAIVGLLILALA